MQKTNTDGARASVRVVPFEPGRGTGDEQAVQAIERASFPQPTFDVAEEATRPWARIWLAREPEGESALADHGSTSARASAAGPAGARLLGGQEGRLLAFLLAWVVADELHVLSVATLPEARRRGVASALLDFAIAYAASHRLRLIVLEARRSDAAALGLYRRFGFTASAVRKAYYADNDEDAIEMVLMLDPETGEVLKGRDAVRITEI